jgi:hypothetical protein
MNTSNPYTPSMQANEEFLRTGGIYRMPLRQLYEKGILTPVTERIEYPKALNLSLGVKEFARATEAIEHGQVITKRWVERREVVAAATVSDSEEESATLAAFALAPGLGVQIEEDWTAERIRYQVSLAQRVAGGSAKASPVRVHLAADPADRALERVRELEARIAEMEAKASEKPAEKPVAPRKASSKGSAALAAAEAAEAPETPEAA